MEKEPVNVYVTPCFLCKKEFDYREYGTAWTSLFKEIGIEVQISYNVVCPPCGEKLQKSIEHFKAVNKCRL